MESSWIERWTDKSSYLINNRKSPVLIVTPWPKGLGTCSEDIYFGLIKAKRDNKKVLFIFPYELFWKFRFGITNRELFKLESDRCDVYGVWIWHLLGGWILTAIFGTARALYLLWRKCLKTRQRFFPQYHVPPFNYWYMAPSIGRVILWKPPGVDYFSSKFVNTERCRQEFEQFQPMRLNQRKYQRAEQIKIQMGIPLSDWFVCLHVRGGGFRGDGKDPRNSSIENYYEGIRVITRAGGWVVRLGDPSMPPLPVMDRVIDYAHTPFKSALMDLYLISQCRFFVGTNSGPFQTAMLLFKKRVILTNLPEAVFCCPMQKGDLAIPKHIYSRSRNRFLSLKEILMEPFDVDDPSCFPYGDDYISYENTSDEIRDLLIEYLDKPVDSPYSDLQETFNHLRKAQIDGWLHKADSAYSSIVYKYCSAVRVAAESGTLGRTYLENNWFEDSLNQYNTQIPILSYNAGSTSMAGNE